MRWLEPFQRFFGHRAQGLALRTYVQGVFSDSDRNRCRRGSRSRSPVKRSAFHHACAVDADRGFAFEYSAPSCPKCQLIDEVVYLRGLDFGPPSPAGIGRLVPIVTGRFRLE
jgi:hypothetical protein